MTEHQKNKKTRRRFLADMLFLGGGVTAAALLAKTRFAGPGEIPPDVAGAMEMPSDLNPTPCSTPGENPPMPGEPMPPQIKGESAPPAYDGDFEIPEDEVHSRGDMIQPPPPPKTGGKPVAPRPAPSPE